MALSRSLKIFRPATSGNFRKSRRFFLSAQCLSGGEGGGQTGTMDARRFVTTTSLQRLSTVREGVAWRFDSYAAAEQSASLQCLSAVREGLTSCLGNVCQNHSTSPMPFGCGGGTDLPPQRKPWKQRQRLQCLSAVREGVTRVNVAREHRATIGVSNAFRL